MHKNAYKSMKYEADSMASPFAAVDHLPATQAYREQKRFLSSLGDVVLFPFGECTSEAESINSYGENLINKHLDLNNCPRHVGRTFLSGFHTGYSR